MIKLLLYFSLLLIPAATQAQDLFNFQTNAKPIEFEKSLVINALTSEYSHVISYTSSGYWSTKKYYYIIGKKDDEWEGELWSTKIATKNNYTKYRKKRIKLQPLSVDSFLTFLDTIRFTYLDQDSLNTRFALMRDSSYLSISISDGKTFSFEVYANGKLRIISSYEPETYQEVFFIKQREIFIEAMNRFKQLFERK